MCPSVAKLMILCCSTNAGGTFEMRQFQNRPKDVAVHTPWHRMRWHDLCGDAGTGALQRCEMGADCLRAGDVVIMDTRILHARGLIAPGQERHTWKFHPRGNSMIQSICASRNSHDYCADAAADTGLLFTTGTGEHPAYLRTH